MTRLLLRLFNAPIFVLLVAVGVALQTSLFKPWPLYYFQPDIVLIAVIWCALKRSFTEGGLLTLIVAEIAEVHTAAPQGFYLIAYMIIFFLVRGFSKTLVIPNLAAMVSIAMFGTLFTRITGFVILSLMGVTLSPWKQALMTVIPAILAEGALSHWMFRGLEKFDWATFKSARAHQSLEDELLLDNEGM